MRSCWRWRGAPSMRARCFPPRCWGKRAGPTRLALIIIALSVATAVIPLDPSTAAIAHHALLIAFIILIGWIGVIAVRAAGQIYSRRLPVDSGGDLLARKHLTQVRILERTATVLIVIVAAACV